MSPHRGAGNLTAIWLDARATPAQLRMSRQLAGTNTWTASTLVTDAAARPTGTPALSVRPDGNAQAAWSDTRGTSADIWGSQYTAGSNSHIRSSFTLRLSARAGHFSTAVDTLDAA